jgi:hypothetical protein
MLFDAHSLQFFAQVLGIGQVGTYEPSPTLVTAAARDIPVVLSQLDGQPDTAPTSPAPSGEKVVLASELISHLWRRKHVRATAAWGIYRLVERGFLGAEVTELQVPEENVEPFTTLYRTKHPWGSVRLVESTGVARCRAVVMVGLPPDTSNPSDGEDQPADEEPALQQAIRTRTVKSLVVWSTPHLWEWWRHTPQASLVCPEANPAAEPEKPRLTFDDQTLTIILDEHPYTVEDPTAFRYFQTVALASPRIVTAKELQGLQGCKGKRPDSYFRRLPEPLQDCIKGKRGEGYHLQLPAKKHA